MRDENEELKVEVGSYDNDGTTVGPNWKFIDP